MPTECFFYRGLSCSTQRNAILIQIGVRLYGTNVVDRTDLGTATRHTKDFAEANDIIANLPIERETGFSISRTHVIFDYDVIYQT